MVAGAVVVLEEGNADADADAAAAAAADDDARRDRSRDSYARARRRFTSDASARELLAAFTSRTCDG